MKTPVQFWRDHLSYFVALVSEYYPLNFEQIAQYKDLLIWHRLSYNPFVIWTPETLQLYKNRIDWKWFCEHKNLPYIRQDDYVFYQWVNWNKNQWQDLSGFCGLAVDLYDHFKGPITKSLYNQLTWMMHEQTPWKDHQFYEYNKEVENRPMELRQIIEKPLVTEHVLSSPYNRTKIPLVFLEKHNQVLDWDAISYIGHIEWNFELIAYFENKWNFNHLYQRNQLMEFALKPFLNDLFIEEVLRDAKDSDIEMYAGFWQQPQWFFHYL